MIDAAETGVRWAGAVGLVAAWGAGAWGAAGGARRAAGRASGLARRIGALGAYLAVGVPYFAMCALLWRPLSVDPSVAARWALLAIGALLGAMGLALYLWGRLTLSEMYNVSSGLGSELYAEHRLVTSGPYRFIRHPMYAGVVLGAVAVLLLYRTWTGVFVVAFLPGAVVKARNEERLLAAELGRPYEEYRRRVPGWLPRIRRPRPPRLHDPRPASPLVEEVGDE